MSTFPFCWKNTCENNLIENSKSKSKKKTKEKEAEVVTENTSSSAFVDYDTRNFEPKTLIQRQTMDYIDKYGDISVEGLEFKVQVGLYKYRKSDNFPKNCANKLRLCLFFHLLHLDRCQWAEQINVPEYFAPFN